MASLDNKKIFEAIAASFDALGTGGDLKDKFRNLDTLFEALLPICKGLTPAEREKLMDSYVSAWGKYKPTTVREFSRKTHLYWAELERE